MSDTITLENRPDTVTLDNQGGLPTAIPYCQNFTECQLNALANCHPVTMGFSILLITIVVAVGIASAISFLAIVNKWWIDLHTEKKA